MLQVRESVSAGGVVLNTNRDVLVVNQDGLTWSLPKGEIESGEDELGAAKREIHEESGMEQLELVKKLGVYERYKMNKEGGDDKSVRKIIHIFLFTTKDMELNPIDPSNPEARWVEKEKVSGLLTHAKDKEFYESVIDEF